MSEAIFMTAQQAYQASLEHFEEQLRKNREELRDLIQRATEKGEFSVIYDRQMFSGIQQWLTDYGYDTERRNVGGRSVWVVSWENKT